LQQQVKVVMKSLSRKERNVLSLIFGLNGVEPVKMEDIASQYELSKERIRQIKDKALKKLKERNPVLFLRIKDL
jgi:RNA polymerase primary sigma factor